MGNVNQEPSREVWRITRTIKLYQFSSVMFVHRKSILYIVIGIKLPSLPVSILYSHVSFLCLLFILSFEPITDFTLYYLKIFDLNM